MLILPQRYRYWYLHVAVIFLVQSDNFMVPVQQLGFTFERHCTMHTCRHTHKYIKNVKEKKVVSVHTHKHTHKLCSKKKPTKLYVSLAWNMAGSTNFVVTGHMKPGYHVTIPGMPICKISLYRHHAIVSAVDQDGNAIKVVHFQRFAGQSKFTVQESDVKVFLDGHRAEQLRIVLHPGAPFTLSQAATRAQSRITDTSFSHVFNNCEHFAEWCHTGKAVSHQSTFVLYSTAILASTVAGYSTAQKLKRRVTQTKSIAANPTVLVINE